MKRLFLKLLNLFKQPDPQKPVEIASWPFPTKDFEPRPKKKPVVKKATTRPKKPVVKNETAKKAATKRKKAAK